MASVVAVTSAALTLLATICVLLRSLSRFCILRQPSLVDHLILVSITLSWALAGLMITLAHLGLGRHCEQIPQGNTEPMSKLIWACRIVYNAALTTVKVSALLRFLRFAIARKSRTAGFVILVIVSMYGSAIVMACLAACQPTAFFWNKSIKDGKCTNDLIFGITTIILNITTNLVVTLLPMYVLQAIRLSKRDKLALQATFAVSGLTCFTSAFRLYSIYLGSISRDLSYFESHIAIWSVVELNTGISCACVPMIRPLAQRVVAKWSTERGPSSGPPQDSNPPVLTPKVPGSIHRDLREEDRHVSIGKDVWRP